MFKWKKAQESKKKNKYYLVYLNGPDWDGPYKILSWNFSAIFTSSGYMPIYCKGEGDEMFDIITNEQYSYVSREEAKQCDYITYFKKKPASVEEVYNALANVNSLLIEKYANKINELNVWSHNQYLNYISEEKEKRTWEATRKDREIRYDDFISNFHNNYGSSNTKTRKK